MRGEGKDELGDLRLLVLSQPSRFWGDVYVQLDDLKTDSPKYVTGTPKKLCK